MRAEMKRWIIIAMLIPTGVGRPARAAPESGRFAAEEQGHDPDRAPQGWRQVPIGIGEDYPKGSRSLAAARRDLEVLSTNGVKVLRISLSWADMEPAPGQFDWSFWDDYVGMANEFGIRLVPYVCYTPEWAAGKAAPPCWRTPPKDNSRFGDFVRALVKRYGGSIHSWEIWNEPDNPEYWTGSAAQFS